jgi:hypothetical protein
MKTSRLYLILTGQVKATDDEAALIMHCVKVAKAELELLANNPSFDVFYKDTLKSLENLTAETQDFPE